MGNSAEERQVFEGFLAVAPLFAGGIAVSAWRQPAEEFPDIDVDLVDGRRIGVELTSWLEESQIGHEKKVEAMEQSFRDALAPEPSNETEHISFIWLSPKRSLSKGQEATFRTELLSLVDGIDKRWESEPDWQTPQGFQFADFTGYLSVAKYLNSLDVHPRARGSSFERGGRHWLTFPTRGGPYSPDGMVDALFECVSAKTTKYGQKPMENAEFHLLVHYDKAFVYNAPVLGINSGYSEAVKAAASRVGNAVGIFGKIFVYVPVADGRKVFQLYP